MGTLKKPSVSFIFLAIILLWLKTYAVYKINFDMKIENWIQEFILLINPLSFLMVVVGIGIFVSGLKQKIYVVITSFIISFILYANVVYYREFSDFITIPLMMQTGNMADLKSSVGELVSWFDLFYFADVLILLVLAASKTPKLSFKKQRNIAVASFYLSAVALAFFNLGMSESQRPELLTRTFDREILVKNIEIGRASCRGRV